MTPYIIGVHGNLISVRQDIYAFFSKYCERILTIDDSKEYTYIYI